ncbi:MAG: amino acid permease [Acidimicrobiia bacterium]|nr:amino acid permease [Acidimicrobiia bacterium]
MPHPRRPPLYNDRVSTAKAGLRSRLPESTATLVRQMGVISAAALVVSNMIGTGIFTTTGFLAADFGQVGPVLLIWLVGALCALAGAFCYSELGVNFPSSGGEYVYLTQAFGPTWGFMTGWVSFFAGFSAPIAAAALAFSDYLGYFWPQLQKANAKMSFFDGALELGGAQLCASVLIAIFTIINLFGVRIVAPLQNVLTATKIAVLIAFIVLGLSAGTGNWDHFTMTTTPTSTTPLAAQFAISLFFAYFSYSGWNAATYVAEELQQPARTLPRALALGAALVAVLYLGLNIVFIYALPLEKMKGVIAIGSLAAASLFGPAVAGIFSGLMAVSLVSTVNAMVTIGPRVYYAMAKNNAFVEAASHVHPRWHTPVFAILCQGVCAMLLTMTSFPDLVLYIGFMLNFFATISVASLLIFRKRPGWQKLKIVSFAYPLIPAIFLMVGTWMTLFGFTLRPMISTLAILTVATGALVYRFRLRPSGGQA